jgi:tyrosyl-tRNA synthetase
MADALPSLTPEPFLDDLAWRGLIHQCTDEPGLRAHLRGGPRRAYAGFDPTADSLTIGNLVPLLMLARLQRAGHAPVVLMGGATGLIGDPSGKSAERSLQTRDRVDANIAGQRRVFERLIDFSAGSRADRAPILVNNADWIGGLSFLDALRDVGKHFSVNQMIQKESVRERLTNRDQGISYTEFSYMILQAYDFAHLHRAMGVTLQMGGSDQWGNITAGLDLIRKLRGSDERDERDAASARNSADPRDAHYGLTTPLVTKADGTKFGKSESGAVWCTSDRTSPYALYQFWLNAADADVGRFLRTFTFLSREEIESLEARHAQNPGQREAQRALAREVTTLLHGPTETDHAERAAKALFSGDIADLSASMLDEVFAGAPTTTHARTLLDPGMPVLDLLVAAGVCASKGQAKELLAGGSITINGRKVAQGDMLSAADLLHGSVAAIRRGKKNWHVTRWQ